MSNRFQFKKFSVNQNSEVMKVGTDGVLLGAWANSASTNIKTIIDIGTGTGLIAMMLAQRFENVIVDAIDLSIEAVELARTNFQNCSWANRLEIYHTNLVEFQASKKYDLLISNPPFFTKSGILNNPTRHYARDIENLSWKQILIFAQKHLSDNGRLEVIYPYTMLDEILAEAKDMEISLAKITKVIPKPGLGAKRVLLSFAKTWPSKTVEDKLIIENEDRHSYHEDYKKLCKDFYLKF